MQVFTSCLSITTWEKACRAAREFVIFFPLPPRQRGSGDIVDGTGAESPQLWQDFRHVRVILNPASRSGRNRSRRARECRILLRGRLIALCLTTASCLA